MTEQMSHSPFARRFSSTRPIVSLQIEPLDLATDLEFRHGFDGSCRAAFLSLVLEEKTCARREITKYKALAMR